MISRQWPHGFTLAMTFALLLLTHPASAQSIAVNGYVDAGRSRGVDPAVLTGDRGFSFTSGMTFDDFAGAANCNSDPVHCTPGQTMSVSGTNGEESGTATLDGVSYYHFGGATSVNRMYLHFDGTITLPSIAPTAVVTTNITFDGNFSHPAPDGSIVNVPLTGHGVAQVFLHSPVNPGYLNSWHVDRILYTLGSVSLPGPSTSVDVGSVGQPGSATFDNENGSFTVTGSGGDIWGATDAFHFYSFSLTEQGDVLVRVDSLTDTNPFAKAGVMIRDSLDPASPHAMLDVKPDGGVEFMTRSTTGGATTFVAGATATFPVWLRLKVAGGATTALMSQDGRSWTTIGSTARGNLGLAGLVVTSHDNATLAQGVFADPTVDFDWPWAHQDVGSVGITGDSAPLVQGIVVAGSGADIWGTADSFQFLSQLHSGDGEIIARVDNQQNTSPFAKAGVMFRDGTGASVADVILDVNPSGNIEFMSRPTAGSATNFIAGGSHAFPVWLRVARTGNTFTGFTSSDGNAWTQVGATVVEVDPVVEAGLAVTSHDNSAINAATFTNVQILASTASNNPSDDIVVYASDIPASNVHGVWAQVSDSTSPNGIRLTTPAGSAPNTANAVASPTDYVDVSFNAFAVSYTLWIRVKALNNSKLSDSLWVQFSDAQVNGSAAYPIGSTSGLLVNLATDGTASSLADWGWVNGAYWLAQPATVSFHFGGPRTLRIQPREYGVQIDQIVLSPNRYFNPSASCPNTCSAAPGPVTNDRTVVSKP